MCFSTSCAAFFTHITYTHRPIAFRKEPSFLRDVTESAVDAGFLASDANQVAAEGSYVQLSDEEILAGNPDLAAFFEMIEVSS